VKLDPVILEILGNKMTATTEEMGITLQRTGRTLYVKETNDFGTALAGLDGKFFAYPHAIGVSGFIDLDCGPSIAAVADLEPGDVIATNHPYESGGLATHTPDLHLIKPYFDGPDIVAYGWTFVHVSDMGGRVPSSISPSSSELFHEGLLIPPLKLMRRGEFVPEVLTLMGANVRAPEDNLGDLKAMLAAQAVGERRVAEMIDQYGRDSFLQAQTDIVEYARRKARAVLRTIPDGVHHFWDYMDDDPATGIPLRIKVTMTVRDGKVKLDFTGTDPQTASPYNVPAGGRRHAWLTLRLAAFVYTHDPGVPLNAGLFDDIEVTAPQETLVSPRFPAPVGIRHATAVRIYETVNGALARALPEVMPACNGGVLIPVVLAEHDAAGGGRNVLVVEPMVGGMGARLGHDGVDGRDSSIANLGNNPIETVEASAAAIVHDYSQRPDSGGPGKWRGGTGLALDFEVLQDGGLVLGRGMERFRFAPWGMAGGHPGRRAHTILNRGREDQRDLGRIDMVEVAAGDTITVLTPGGGGYGDPLERDPERVRADVVLGLVSRRGAAEDYGVAIDGEDRVDPAATNENRRRMRDRPMATPFDFGSQRRSWEAAFDDSTQELVTARLLELPGSLRQAARQALFAGVDETLLEDPAATRRRLMDNLEKMV
jgi:N-methylhydantoinase B